jgi:agmatine/peptidylarginine deiminase
MGVVNSKGKLVQFLYEPSYLDGYEKIKTNPFEVYKKLDINPQTFSIVVDGGNVEICKNKALMTDMVFKENKEDKLFIMNILYEALEVDEIIFLPKQPYDYTGHIDAMARFVDEGSVVLNDFSLESKTYLQKLHKFISATDLEIFSMKYSKSFLEQYKWGAYLNFLDLGDVLFVPIYGIDEDENAINQLQNIYKNKK